jgi:plastocyanin
MVFRAAHRNYPLTSNDVTDATLNLVSVYLYNHHMKTPRTFHSAAIAAAFVALSACGSSSAPAATLPSDIGLEVDAGPGIRFNATSYTATAGTVKVAYVNKDSARHTLVIIDSNKVQLPGELEVAKSGAFEVKDYDLKPGEYTLFCNVPGHQNMKATLTVS